MKIICFYLPQFHPIPENDNWWGKGFTEWMNVARAKPRFLGHYQPHIPADLGFYDLRLEESRIAQADLASMYGISGFCYYHYWFNGKMLLERPFNDVLSSGKPDFPFCLCWANENWTRAWDGEDRHVLIEQDYTNYAPAEHMRWLSKAFKDKRYIRVNGKPIFIVYRTDEIPNLKTVLQKWRDEAAAQGIPNLHLCAVKSFKNKLNEDQLFALGFDAVVEFHPHHEFFPRQNWWCFVKYFPAKFFNRILRPVVRGMGLPSLAAFSYAAMVKKILSRERKKRVYPCVFPSWDNSARRKVGATVIQNNNERLYEKWLSRELEYVSSYPVEERLVFVNAWNEWAEGCHLEPDIRNGRRFLEATKRALCRFGKCSNQKNG